MASDKPPRPDRDDIQPTGRAKARRREPLSAAGASRSAAPSDPRKKPAEKKAATAKKPTAKKSLTGSSAPAKRTAPRTAAATSGASESPPRRVADPADTVDLELELPDVDQAGWWRAVSGTGRGIVDTMRTNWKRTAISAGAGWVIGWTANVWVMARTYDGFVVPKGSVATGTGNVARGMSYWFIVSMLVSATVNYRINVGSERFWQEVRAFPNTIRGLVRDDGVGAATHALFGFAGGTVITYTLGPSLSGAMAVGVLFAVATLLRPLLIGGLTLGWRWAVKKITPDRKGRAPIEAVTVATLGGAGAMLVAALIADPTAKIVFGVGAAVAAFSLSQRVKPSVAVIVVLAGAAGVIGVLVDAAPVLADDGGWRECGSSLERWWSCSGSDRTRWLAVYGAGGSAFGAGAGSALLPPTTNQPPKPWAEMTDDERNKFKSDYIQRFIDTHPNASPEQLQRFIDGLNAREAGFWEKQWEFTKDFWNAYWEDLSSGKQAEGLGGMFVGMYDGFSSAASKTWNELSQIDDTLREFPGVFWDDLSSGEQEKRLKGMIEFGGKTLERANEIINMSPEELSALYDKHGRQNVDKFLAKMGEFERSLQNADPTEIRRKIGELAGAAEFEALLGGATDKGLKLSKNGLAFLNEAKLTKHMDESVDALRLDSQGVKVTGLTPDEQFARHNMLELAKQRPVKLSPEEADRLFGLDEKILLERQGTTLQYTEGKAAKGVTTQYKLGDENSIMAKQLRTEHPDIWTGKWNPVGDKSFVPGEEAFMSADDLARFKKHPPQPGETVNYTPKELSEAELSKLPPELQSRYADRMKDATAWDKNTGFDSRKSVDYSDPKVRAKYGEMYVPEDPGSPVAKAEFWKDPADNRVYVRYQTKNGEWSAPRRQASDIDTVTHQGGERLTYDQSRDLQYKQSGGQIGEGDTPAWARGMLEEGPGGYTLKDPAMKDSLYKAIDALHKADGQAVVEQTADGLFLKTARYPELDMVKDAARKLDAAGQWTPGQRAALVGKGIL